MNPLTLHCAISLYSKSRSLTADDREFRWEIIEHLVGIIEKRSRLIVTREKRDATSSNHKWKGIGILEASCKKSESFASRACDTVVFRIKETSFRSLLSQQVRDCAQKHLNDTLDGREREAIVESFVHVE